MDQFLLPQDIEQAVIDELDGLTVGTSIPDTKPPLFFRVLVTGGAGLNLVQDEPFVTLEAFGLRETAAFDGLSEALARLQLAVKKRGHIGSVPATQIRFVGLPQNYPMPSVPTHKRYISTIAPAVRRRIITL